MLVALDVNRERVNADSASKGSAYVCPSCGAALVVKQGSVKIWHYAHVVANATCPMSEPESAIHMEMKNFMYNALMRKDWVEQCEMEYQLGQFRADVWAKTKRGDVAVECQVSPITPEYLISKLIAYSRMRVNSLYVIHISVLKKKAPLSSLHKKEVRIQAWVRALHALYLGRVYVYDAGIIYPVHFSEAQSYQDAYYDSDGEEHGGYFVTLTATKRISVGERVHIIPAGFECRLSTPTSWLIKGSFRIAMFADKKFW